LRSVTCSVYSVCVLELLRWMLHELSLVSLWAPLSLFLGLSTGKVKQRLVRLVGRINWLNVFVAVEMVKLLIYLRTYVWGTVVKHDMVWRLIGSHLLELSGVLLCQVVVDVSCRHVDFLNALDLVGELWQGRWSFLCEHLFVGALLLGWRAESSVLV
jgi:hypothetical protein